MLFCCIVLLWLLLLDALHKGTVQVARRHSTLDDHLSCNYAVACSAGFLREALRELDIKGLFVLCRRFGVGVVVIGIFWGWRERKVVGEVVRQVIWKVWEIVVVWKAMPAHTTLLLVAALRVTRVAVIAW